MLRQGKDLFLALQRAAGRCEAVSGTRRLALEHPAERGVAANRTGRVLHRYHRVTFAPGPMEKAGALRQREWYRGIQPPFLALTRNGGFLFSRSRKG